MIQFCYLAILLFTISYPLYKSFEDKVYYFSKWKFVFQATLPPALLFILWDLWFTTTEVWFFNKKFITGIFIGPLPLEEYLFFFLVPFSCLFIHNVLYYFFKEDVLKKAAPILSLALLLLCCSAAMVYSTKLYPLVLFGLLGGTISLFHFVLKPPFMGRFYLTFLFCLIPFLVVNGLLTGLPILTYNPNHISELFIFTIPMEDLFYGMLYLLWIISLYEYLTRKNETSKIAS